MDNREINEILQMAKLSTPTNFGGNSTVTKIDNGAGSFVVKDYSERADGLKRQLTETSALIFLGNKLPSHVTKFHGTSEDGLKAVHSWVSGAHPVLDSKTISQMLDFLEKLKNVSAVSRLSESRFATDNIVGGQSLKLQIEERLAKLRDSMMNSHSILTNLEIAYLKLQGEVKEDDSGVIRILSPSDFGVHNLLVNSSTGALVCIDLEFFGWDDAHKLVLDTLLHPAAIWKRAEAHYFLAGAAKAMNLSIPRLVDLWPLVCLKWATICLNRHVNKLRSNSSSDSTTALAMQYIDFSSVNAKSLGHMSRLVGRDI